MKSKSKKAIFFKVLNERRQRKLNILLKKLHSIHGFSEERIEEKKEILEEIKRYNTRPSPLLAPVKYKRRTV